VSKPPRVGEVEDEGLDARVEGVGDDVDGDAPLPLLPQAAVSSIKVAVAKSPSFDRTPLPRWFRCISHLGSIDATD